MSNILETELQADRDRAGRRALESWRRSRVNLCQNCGEYTDELYDFGGQRVCDPCLDAEFGPWNE